VPQCEAVLTRKIGRMASQLIDVRSRKVAVLEAGAGEPLVYLHGFADVHGVAGDFQPFHQRLAQGAKVIAPAHPGCAGSSELTDGCSIDDVVFHTLEVLDARGLERFDLVGHCAGGWIAAELAVRHPEKVARLVLIGACGLFVPGEPIGDVFMHAQPERGVDLTTLRGLLFSDASTPVAERFFPDGRGDIDEEMRRYQMLRFGSFVGFKPPYFHHRALRERLYRAAMPALVIWGEHDRMVPRAHGDAYVAGLAGASELKIVNGAGHAAPLEEPEATATLLIEFLNDTRAKAGTLQQASGRRAR
jgi:pimeloyl-ACP methyl ester carboxylesterase